MDITITVTETTEEIIKDEAEAIGKDVEDFVRDFVELSFSGKRRNGVDSNGEHRHHNLMRMAGMFNSGVSDTSERMHEILYSEDFDPAQGFGTDK